MYSVSGPLNGYTKWFLGFSLYVSNTTDTKDGILCFKDTTFNTSTIPAVFRTTCFERGQYVIYHNERLQGIVYPDDYSRAAYNDLCEVEVFGKQYHVSNSFFSTGNCILFMKSK